MWSFGIVLWELVSRGADPYPTMSAKDVWEAVASGYRMPRPSNCPEFLYDIMVRCWRVDPTARPTWSTLLDELCELSEDALVELQVGDPSYNVRRVSGETRVTLGVSSLSDSINGTGGLTSDDAAGSSLGRRTSLGGAAAFALAQNAIQRKSTTSSSSGLSDLLRFSPATDSNNNNYVDVATATAAPATTSLSDNYIAFEAVAKRRTSACSPMTTTPAGPSPLRASTSSSTTTTARRSSAPSGISRSVSTVSNSSSVASSSGDYLSKSLEEAQTSSDAGSSLDSLRLESDSASLEQRPSPSTESSSSSVAPPLPRLASFQHNGRTLTEVLQRGAFVALFALRRPSHTGAVFLLFLLCFVLQSVSPPRCRLAQTAATRRCRCSRQTRPVRRVAPAR